SIRGSPLFSNPNDYWDITVSDPRQDPRASLFGLSTPQLIVPTMRRLSYREQNAFTAPIDVFTLSAEKDQDLNMANQLWGLSKQSRLQQSSDRSVNKGDYNGFLRRLQMEEDRRTYVDEHSSSDGAWLVAEMITYLEWREDLMGPPPQSRNLAQMSVPRFLWAFGSQSKTVPGYKIHNALQEVRKIDPSISESDVQSAMKVLQDFANQWED
ncbi:MAG: hypothetical protein EA369_00015, partial [Bradymonadales bacterium]